MTKLDKALSVFFLYLPWRGELPSLDAYHIKACLSGLLWRLIHYYFHSAQEANL